MFLLLDDLKKIVYISKMATRETIDDIDYIRVSANNLVIDSGFEIVEVDSVPINVVAEKYLYVDGEFIINENYVDDSMVAEYETRLSTLQESNAIQEENINKLEDDLTSLEEMVLDVTASLLE